MMWLKSCQISHHEWENIHDWLKFNLDGQYYQLNNIYIYLQSECLHHQLYISFQYTYHKERDHHIFPKSECGIFGHFLCGFSQSSIWALDYLVTGFGLFEDTFPHPDVDKKHHFLHSKYDWNNDHQGIIRIILFNYSWFDTGRYINNTLFLWYITTDSRYFIRFNCL